MTVSLSFEELEKLGEEVYKKKHQLEVICTKLLLISIVENWEDEAHMKAGKYTLEDVGRTYYALHKVMQAKDHTKELKLESFLRELRKVKSAH